MAVDWSCVMRWTIYGLAALVVIMSVATIAVDQEDNSKQKGFAAAGNGNAYTNKTGSNVLLFLLMLATAASALVHICWPRLWLIALSALLGLLFFILRLFLPHEIHFELIFFVPLLIGLDSFYIYWVAFHEKTDKDESLFKTMTKPDAKASSIRIKMGGDSSHHHQGKGGPH